MLKSIVFSAGVALAAGPALAAPIYTQDFTANTPLATDAPAFEISFANATAATGGMLVFDLNGFRSLDGNDYYIDIFSLAVNGISVFSGTFNMSGGGTNELVSGSGSFTTTAYVCPSVTYCGGQTTISVPIALLANNSNTLSFSYASPLSFQGTDRSGPQNFDDEAWGVGRVTVNAVPEPETYAMLLAGLGMLGTIVRRRRTQPK
jgi:hypothetical protein